MHLLLLKEALSAPKQQRFLGIRLGMIACEYQCETEQWWQSTVDAVAKAFSILVESFLGCMTLLLKGPHWSVSAVMVDETLGLFLVFGGVSAISQMTLFLKSFQRPPLRCL